MVDVPKINMKQYTNVIKNCTAIMLRKDDDDKEDLLMFALLVNRIWFSFTLYAPKSY